MKKVTFLVFLIILSNFSFAQNLSKTQKLEATCKVWGFLKYYHPKVASGEFNWDQKLFEVLPKIEKAKNQNEFSLVLENWITSLGEIKKVEPIIQPKDTLYFDKNFDLSWIDKNKLLSKKLSKKLRFIERNRHQGKQHYVHVFQANQISIKNEDFSTFNYESKNERILGMFMYWNLIEYFFPNKYLMDIKWDKTLEEMLPNFIEAKNEVGFFLAFQKLTVRLNDSHVVFHKYDGVKKHYLPIIAKIIDEKMIITEILDSTIVKKDGIKTGDLMVKINDKEIKELIEEKRNLISASNESSFLNRITEPILTGTDDSIKIEFLIDGKNIIKNINWVDLNENRYSLRNKPNYKKGVAKLKLLANNIGYVNMGLLKEKNIPAMIEELKSTKAIVFDLRNYPNGTLFEVANFLNSKEQPFVIYTNPDLTYPGRYKWTQVDSCGKENPNNYKGKVIILLNEDSVSQPEWTAMGFQTAGNTTIIGSQTGGADGNVSDIQVFKQIFTQFTGLGVYYPDRRQTQRIGIIPDIEVKPTILGIQQGKDEVLDRAIQFIETGK